MKVVWLINNLIPEVSELIGGDKNPFGGWVTGILHAVVDNKTMFRDPLSMVLICPGCKETCGEAKDFAYYTFDKNAPNISEYQVKYFEEILKKEKPDIIQLFGSEYLHANSMVKAAAICNYSDRVLLHIQGLTSVYANHIYGRIGNRTILSFSLRDLVKKDNVILAKKKMKNRGQIECATIKGVAGVLGRTEWDKACASFISPDKKYFLSNEVLRDSFYSATWNYEMCQKHTIFFSQPMGHVKGFYQLLKAFPKVLEVFPDARIRTTGKCLDYSTLGYFKQSAFQNEMKRIIKRNKMQDKIEFLGVLDEKAMVQELIKANVFVLSSSIENSPNSLGEAMLVGTPCIASDVGGVTSMMTHGKEGFVYPFDEEYMLAWYIIRLFNEPELCNMFSVNGSKHANKSYSKNYAVENLAYAYSSIINGNKKNVEE